MNIDALESSLAGPGNIRVLGAAGQWSKATYNNSDYSVFGLIEFRPTHTYTHLLPLSPQERRQYSFWRQIINDDMEGQLYRCEVKQAYLFSRPIPRHQLHLRKADGFLNRIEMGEESALMEELRRVALDILDLLGFAPTAILNLPVPFAYLVAAGTWRSFMLPSYNRRDVRATSSQWNTRWQMLRGFKPSMLPQPPPDLVLSVGQAPELSPELMQSAADHMQRQLQILESIGYPTDVDFKREVHSCLKAMQAYVDEQDGAAVRRLTTEFGNIGGPQEALEFLDMNTTAGPSTRIMYSSSFMIKCLLQSGLLRSDDKLVASIKSSLVLVLPETIRKPMLSMLDSVILPGKSQISRWRFLLDASLMMLLRQQLQTAYSNGERFIRWMQVDSSPQGGRNYELAVILQLERSKLLTALRLASALEGFARTVPTEDEYAVESGMISELKELFHFHWPPPMVLGSRQSGVKHKFQATMQMLFLDCGPFEHGRQFQRLCEENMAVTTDMGDE